MKSSKIPLTRVEKEFARVFVQKHGDLSATAVIEKLCRLGILDYSMCKVFAIRRWVESTMRGGSSKVDAMWLATEYFCVSYAYVRKCIYYYTDLNL